VLFNKVNKLQLLLRSNYLFPSYLQIEPTAKCNLKCTTCLRSRLKDEVNSDMELDTFKSIVDQLRSHVYSTQAINLTGCGEPFLNPNLIDMVKYAKKKGLKVTLVSNFTVTTEKKLLELIEAELDTLAVSIDGATKKTFEAIRIGAVFEDILKKVIFVVKMKEKLGVRKPKLYFNCVIFKENSYEAKKIVGLAEKLRIDGIVFSKPVFPGVKYSETNISGIPVEELVSTKVKVDVKYLAERAPHCMALRACYVTFDGKVMPCNVVIETVPRREYPSYQMGELTKQSLADIWFSRKYKKLRTRIINTGYGNMPFCKSCPSYGA